MTRKLDDRDLTILAALQNAPAGVDALAARLDAPTADVETRLDDLADNALVRVRDDDAYEVTGNGVRVLRATSLGLLDDRIDTPESVDAAIEGAGLPPDREDAVRAAFAYLHYWGTATSAELADAVYDEHPVGYDSRTAWWEEFVADALADLPAVTPPGEDGEWRYAGPATVEEGDLDGRALLRAGGAPAGDARHAIESSGLNDEEREAARAAFAVIFDRGTATAAEIADAVFDDHPAGYDDSAEWWDGFLREALSAVPSLERAGDQWQYAER